MCKSEFSCLILKNHPRRFCSRMFVEYLLRSFSSSSLVQPVHTRRDYQDCWFWLPEQIQDTEFPLSASDQVPHCRALKRHWSWLKKHPNQVDLISASFNVLTCVAWTALDVNEALGVFHNVLTPVQTDAKFLVTIQKIPNWVKSCI